MMFSVLYVIATTPPKVEVVKTLTVTATAYTPDPAENGGWTVTATGAPLGMGVIAVDPKVIPLGTKLRVPGYGEGVALDTGGAIKGNRIDVCHPSKKWAMNWGRRKVVIEILK